MKSVQEGDLVTLTLDEFSGVSNTYLVAKKLPDQSLLQHPLAPECYLLKDDSELNKSFPDLQKPLEKCLFFAKKHKDLLGYIISAELDALCYYFVLRKTITTKQRHDLANICGRIASFLLQANLTQAIALIKANEPLLDEHSQVLLSSLGNLSAPSQIKNKGERYTIFNIAGFVLAQNT